jgi:uracil-DNA glycosylase family 4
MIHRNRMLQAMGLAPIWRLRERPLDGVAAEPLAASVWPAPAPIPAPSSVPRPAPAPSPARISPPPADPQDQRGQPWPLLIDEIAQCRACGLCKARTQTVVGSGDRSADWLFVGEAPGVEEDRRGEPFVGAAGQLLDNLLAAIDLDRTGPVYIANAVKCRPPGNRAPLAEEMQACRPFLMRQIALVRPRMIVALGRPAAMTLLQKEVKISAVRGQVHDCEGIPLLITYHPAYLLRNPLDKALAWEDLCAIRAQMTALSASTGDSTGASS